MKTAVLLLTFNRLDYLKEVFAVVRSVKPPRLYLASDGPRQDKPGESEQVQTVRKWMLDNIDWKCDVKTRFLSTNSGGCARGVSGAVTWFFENEPEGIILEDDCVPDKTFFKYCETLLDKYRKNKNVWHIAGAAPIDVDIPESYYFAKIQHCWGWATWADRWSHFDWDLSHFDDKKFSNFSNNRNVISYWKNIKKGLMSGEIDSWAYRWTFNIVDKNGLCINPAKNLVTNIGESGVHYDGTNTTELNHKTYPIIQIIHPKELKFNKDFIDRIYVEHFHITNKTPLFKMIIKNLFSVDNVCYDTGKRKTITFLGIKIKI